MSNKKTDKVGVLFNGDKSKGEVYKNYLIYHANKKGKGESWWNKYFKDEFGYVIK